MKKPKLKKRGREWIIYVNRAPLVRTYSAAAARLWLDVLGRSEKQCT